MNLFRTSALCAVLLGSLAPAQSSTKPFYLESFRKGSTRITETKFHAAVDAKSPTHRVSLKDSTGEDHFVFSLQPTRAGVEDQTILSWTANLVDLRRRFYLNLLLPSRDPYLNEGVPGKAMRLDSNSYAGHSAGGGVRDQGRGFYCVLQVTNQVNPESWHFDALEAFMQVRM